MNAMIVCTLSPTCIGIRMGALTEFLYPQEFICDMSALSFRHLPPLFLDAVASLAPSQKVYVFLLFLIWTLGCSMYLFGCFYIKSLVQSFVLPYNGTFCDSPFKRYKWLTKNILYVKYVERYSLQLQIWQAYCHHRGEKLLAPSLI